MGDHPEEWYDSRGSLAWAVVDEMKAAGMLIFAGGIVEKIEKAFSSYDKGLTLEAMYTRFLPERGITRHFIWSGLKLNLAEAFK